VGENGIVEQTPQQEGRLMTMVIAPSRRKRKVESAPGGSNEASIPASEEEQHVPVIDDPIIEESVTEDPANIETGEE
jgi:hypothetical protein